MPRNHFDTDIDIHKEKEIVHLKFKGSIAFSFTDSFGELLEKILDDGHRKILLDFNDVDIITSNGLRVLLVFAKKAKKDNRRFVFCNMQQEVYKIFEISGFSNIFEISPTAETAFLTLAK